MLVAVVGTPLLGPGAGVVGVPPLPPLLGRPRVNGLAVALVGDVVQFVYSDTRGTQLLVITEALASLLLRADGRAVAIQGTLMSDPEVAIGVPPQLLVQAT